jgi:hypothetical protein
MLRSPAEDGSRMWCLIRNLWRAGLTGQNEDRLSSDAMKERGLRSSWDSRKWLRLAGAHVRSAKGGPL